MSTRAVFGDARRWAGLIAGFVRVDDAKKCRPESWDRSSLDTETTIGAMSARPAKSTESSAGSEQVDAYLDQLPEAQRQALRAVRHSLVTVLPHAEECMKYGMPAVALDGKGIAGYAAFKDHCGYFPMSGSVLSAAGNAVAKYETTKGGFRFGVDERLPMSLIKRLVKLRIAELGAVENGRRMEYYGNGQRKAAGPMRDGQLHGKWQWFRQDGTLMRTGQFAHGEQVGTWTTFDRVGKPTKTTKY